MTTANEALREAAEEAAEWLEKRPDMTEGDAAVSSRLRRALQSAPLPLQAPSPGVSRAVPPTWKAIARSICAETCAFKGEPACFLVEDDQGNSMPWPAPACDEPGCEALAKRVLVQLQYAAPEAPLPGQSETESDAMSETGNLANVNPQRGDVAAPLQVPEVATEGHPTLRSEAEREDRSSAGTMRYGAEPAATFVRSSTAPSPAGQQGEAMTLADKLDQLTGGSLPLTGDEARTIRAGAAALRASAQPTPPASPAVVTPQGAKEPAQCWACDVFDRMELGVRISADAPEAQIKQAILKIRCPVLVIASGGESGRATILGYTLAEAEDAIDSMRRLGHTKIVVVKYAGDNA